MTLLLVLAVGLLGGCVAPSWESGYYWQSGKYLIAHNFGFKGATLEFEVADEIWYETLVGPTVYAIGADDTYIVVKQHPGGDTSHTHYFVVERTTGADPKDAKSGVWGPIAERDFERYTARLSLPEFTVTFDDFE